MLFANIETISSYTRRGLGQLSGIIYSQRGWSGIEQAAQVESPALEVFKRCVDAVLRDMA